MSLVEALVLDVEVEDAGGGLSSSPIRARRSSQYSSSISCSSVVKSLRMMFSTRMRALSSLFCCVGVSYQLAAFFDAVALLKGADPVRERRRV